MMGGTKEGGEMTTQGETRLLGGCLQLTPLYVPTDEKSWAKTRVLGGAQKKRGVMNTRTMGT